MGEAQDLEGQRTVNVTDMPYMPATVDSHTERSDGMTLHTIDNDPDSDIEIYDDDDRQPHRTGETPEWAQEE